MVRVFEKTLFLLLIGQIRYVLATPDTETVEGKGGEASKVSKVNRSCRQQPQRTFKPQNNTQLPPFTPHYILQTMLQIRLLGEHTDVDRSLLSSYDNLCEEIESGTIRDGETLSGRLEKIQGPPKIPLPIRLHAKNFVSNNLAKDKIQALIKKIFRELRIRLHENKNKNTQFTSLLIRHDEPEDGDVELFLQRCETEIKSHEPFYLEILVHRAKGSRKSFTLKEKLYCIILVETLRQYYLMNHDLDKLTFTRHKGKGSKESERVSIIYDKCNNTKNARKIYFTPDISNPLHIPLRGIKEAVSLFPPALVMIFVNRPDLDIKKRVELLVRKGVKVAVVEGPRKKMIQASYRKK